MPGMTHDEYVRALYRQRTVVRKAGKGIPFTNQEAAANQILSPNRDYTPISSLPIIDTSEDSTGIYQPTIQASLPPIQWRELHRNGLRMVKDHPIGIGSGVASIFSALPFFYLGIEANRMVWGALVTNERALRLIGLNGGITSVVANHTLGTFATRDTIHQLSTMWQRIRHPINRSLFKTGLYLFCYFNASLAAGPNAQAGIIGIKDRVPGVVGTTLTGVCVGAVFCISYIVLMASADSLLNRLFRREQQRDLITLANRLAHQVATHHPDDDTQLLAKLPHDGTPYTLESIAKLDLQQQLQFLLTLQAHFQLAPRSVTVEKATSASQAVIFFNGVVSSSVTGPLAYTFYREFFQHILFMALASQITAGASATLAAVSKAILYGVYSMGMLQIITDLPSNINWLRTFALGQMLGLLLIYAIIAIETIPTCAGAFDINDRTFHNKGFAGYASFFGVYPVHAYYLFKLPYTLYRIGTTVSGYLRGMTQQQITARQSLSQQLFALSNRLTSLSMESGSTVDVTETTYRKASRTAILSAGEKDSASRQAARGSSASFWGRQPSNVASADVPLCSVTEEIGGSDDGPRAYV